MMKALISKLPHYYEVYRQVRTLPTLEIDLMYREALNNDEFFAKITKEYFDESLKRHSTMPLWRRNRMGMAIYCIHEGGEGYFADIESSGRRNIRKARRLGYTFRHIDFNEHLKDISEIRSSTDVRQGEMPDYLKNGVVNPISDPVSANPHHAYNYYGVFLDDKLYAYAGCFIAGEVCLIQHILGHAAKLNDGVVPLLISEIVNQVCQEHPAVKYLGYGTFFGASPTMQRFKKKFGLAPKNVSWVLGE